MSDFQANESTNDSGELGFKDVFDKVTTGAGVGVQVFDTVGQELGGAVPFLGTALDAYGFCDGLYSMGSAMLAEDGKGLHDDRLYEGAGAVVNNGVSLAGTGLAAALGIMATGTSAAAGTLLGGPLGTAVGGAAGAAAALTIVEGANTAMGVGMAAADGLGALAGHHRGEDAEFSADGITGSLIRGAFGDESLGWGVGSSVSNALGGGVGADIAGGAAGTAANLIAMPLNGIDTVLGGAVNFYDDLTDDDEEESTAWQDFKTSVNPFAGMY